MDDLDRELGPHGAAEDCHDSSDDNSSKGGKKLKCPVVNPIFCLGERYSVCVCVCSYYMKTFLTIIWRITTEILHHHPNSTMDDYNNVYERMKHSGVRHHLMICLEHAFHLLLHGRTEDAKLQLSAAESWRHGKESAAQHQRTKLIQAYRSLLDYAIWCDKKLTSSNNHFDSDDNQGMQNNFRQASVNLKETLKNPGVWDPFILSYVDMLEFYEDHEEALKILNEYAYDNSFPPNPNAHVYLYQYLKRHNASEKKLIRVLKILHALVPSHELMLDYSAFLLDSENKKDIEKAFGVILEMLDFTCWRTNMDIWKCLKAIIQKLQIQEDWENVVCEKMAARKDWWPALHFTSFQASKDLEENPELWEVKASLAKVLCPNQTLKYTAERITNGKWT
ncbi:TATA box-binding protein-associated factor RNA polymerase I subunit A [Stegastes partitus]|uniref:TATA box-binding protein-associated factor RNA polymerase I subunit A n=2 Tax=Stegastes partitus TaxID=144197 RepID=A0A9Y4JQC0_9TELE|nr:PREDICTED: TATA box-binding protein-associated factor RNA polymerase I subunit A [Stegastes partitus]